jgi:hypothetical protein
MRALTTRELLDVWETATDQSPADRALALLAAACPDQSPDALADLSIGQRDACLLTLRTWAFGPQLTGLATCTRCGERLELTFQADDIRAPEVEPPREPLSLTVAGYEVRFRLPNSRDLKALGRCAADDGARLLLGRCVISASARGRKLTGAELPKRVAQAIAERLAEAEPQAAVEFGLRCPACDYAWLSPFDIVPYFWSEIEVWAARLLREVHLLARTYGWREADILALSPRRRQCYLEMVAE